MSGTAFIGKRFLAVRHRPRFSLTSSVRVLSSTKPTNRASKKSRKVGKKCKRTPITENTKRIEKGLAREVSSGCSKRLHKKSKAKTAPVLHPNEPAILIPGGRTDPSDRANNDLSSIRRTGTSPYYHLHSHRGGGSYRLTKVLPAVNASALLDPKDYIKKSATPGGTVTISGSDAARRMLRGRQALLDVLRHELLDRPRNKRNPPKPYALIGHGVPQQLLQDHINMADSLLSYHGRAAEISFTNFHGDLSFHWMRIRSRNGENRACQWPPPAASTEHPEWEYQMELYMTVLARLTSNLGMALRRDSPSAASVVEDDDDDFVTCADTVGTTTPRYWSVELLRGVAYPPHLLPNHLNSGPLIPIVEWTPREGISAPGHVCIRLQGTSNLAFDSKASSLRRKRKAPVTLVFDACFRNNLFS